MQIYYSPYFLKPIKRLNRLANLDDKPGIFLKAVIGGKTSYADYFPYLQFGDKNCEEFLAQFRFQNSEYDQKMLYFLKRDAEYQHTKHRLIKNHQLWTGSEPLESDIIKYKMLHLRDDAFLKILERGKRLRLDGNGLFRRKTFNDLLNKIAPALISNIEYVEDPLIEDDWSDLGVPTARDIIPGTGHDYYIFHPNCEFYPTHEKKVIFSGYLGSQLGVWHTYCELLERGNLDETHGIIAEDFYENYEPIFSGSYQKGFTVRTEAIEKIYADLVKRDWKELCTI